MNAFSLISNDSVVAIGRADFLSAELAERATHRASAAAERIQAQRELQQAENAFTKSFRERFSDELGESDLALCAARELADLAVAFQAQASALILTLRNIEPVLVEPADDLSELALDLLTDELSRDPLARDLAGVARAALKAGIQ